MLTTMSRINQAQMESSVEGEKAARGEQERALELAKQYKDASYQHSLKEIEENKTAREKESSGAFWGTIFGGFIIGSLIGKAIGNACGDGNKDDALAEKKASGVSDLLYDKAKDRMSFAKDQVEEATKKQDDLRKFGGELRDDQFIGL